MQPMVLSRYVPLGPKDLCATFMMMANNPPFSLSNSLVITLLNNVPITALPLVAHADRKAVKSDSRLDRHSSWACRAGRRQ